MSSPDGSTAKPSRVAKVTRLVSTPHATKKSPKKSVAATSGDRAQPARTRKRAAQIRKSIQPSAAAAELTLELEKGLAEGRFDVLPPQAIQALFAALCKTYAANAEAGRDFPVLPDRNSVSSTDVMVACGALLKSANLQVFELGLWQSWTGR